MFDFVILNWNGRAWLPGCLASLRAQGRKNFAVTVVDNGSSDGSVEYLRQEFPEARVIPLGENAGFCRGNNLGAAAVGGEWLVILNNDTVCSPDLTAELERAAADHPDFHILSCKLLRMQEPHLVDNKGIHYSRLLRASQIDSGAPDRPGEEAREVFGASGAALVVKRSVVESIGLFDERFFLYHEDVDFAVRARLRGFRCLYVPRAVIHHQSHGSSWRIPRQRLYYNQRNMEVVALKNIPAGLLWKYGFLHLLYSAFQVLRWTLRGYGVTMLRSKADGLRMGWRLRREHPPAAARADEFAGALAGQFHPGRRAPSSAGPNAS